ncbi:MAG: hypothetical protein ACJ76V_13260 [Thermoleophilaceae bacterium]|jgi:hypothetical protein
MNTHRTELDIATRVLKLVLVMVAVLVGIALLTVAANALFT